MSVCRETETTKEETHLVADLVADHRKTVPSQSREYKVKANDFEIFKKGIEAGLCAIRRRGVRSTDTGENHRGKSDSIKLSDPIIKRQVS